MQISKRLSDHIVVQFGVSLGQRDGCVIEALSAPESAALSALLAEPNGGIAFENGQFTALPVQSPPLESYMDELRAERDRRLAESDWTQLPDAPVDAELWRPYRQTLRDFPATVKDPTRPLWPVPPGGTSR